MPNETPDLSRRELIGGLAASAVLAQAGRLEAQSGRYTPTRSHAHTSPSPYLVAALGAEKWIARSAIRGTEGVTWPADPLDVKSVERNLYTGTPGVVLFYAELARVTGDKAFLQVAVDGARALASWVTAPSAPSDFKGEGAGLYTGLAGIAFVLERVHRASGDDVLGAAARTAMVAVASLASPSGSGTRWSESNDIISGSAGIGLTLLWAAHALGMRDGIDVAREAGRGLLVAGVEAHGGLTWPISPSVPRRYPNFSHGAGGVGYFLARLHEATGEPMFLDGARKAAAYLQAVATSTPSGGRMVFHSEPGNEQLFYLSWCHGPSGTARLFHTLARLTKDRAYAAFADQLNVATRDMKVPEQSPGYWNNISQCCGNCGVVEYLVAQHDRTGDTRHLDYAKLIADNALQRATAEGEGLKWIQAEHRVRPEFLVAQTGLMQGAAGVGLAMLHLDGALSKRKPFVVLPDNPYFG